MRPNTWEPARLGFQGNLRRHPAQSETPEMLVLLFRAAQGMPMGSPAGQPTTRGRRFAGQRFGRRGIHFLTRAANSLSTFRNPVGGYRQAASKLQKEVTVSFAESIYGIDNATRDHIDGTACRPIQDSVRLRVTQLLCDADRTARRRLTEQPDVVTEPRFSLATACWSIPSQYPGLRLLLRLRHLGPKMHTSCWPRSRAEV